METLWLWWRSEEDGFRVRDKDENKDINGDGMISAKVQL